MSRTPPSSCQNRMVREEADSLSALCSPARGHAHLVWRFFPHHKLHPFTEPSWDSLGLRLHNCYMVYAWKAKHPAHINKPQSSTSPAQIRSLETFRLDFHTLALRSALRKMDLRIYLSRPHKWVWGQLDRNSGVSGAQNKF